MADNQGPKNLKDYFKKPNLGVQSSPMSLRSIPSTSGHRTDPAKRKRNLSKTRVSRVQIKENVTEIPNPNSEKYDSDQKGDFIYDAEVLRLGDDEFSIDELSPRSGVFFNDSLFSQFELTSQGSEFVQFDPESESNVPFQRTKKSTRLYNEIGVKLKKLKFLKNPWSFNVTLNSTKPQTEEPKEKKVKKIKFLDDIVTPKEDYKTKAQLQDLYFYILQLILFSGIALSMVSSNMYYLTALTTALFFDTPESNLNGKNENGFDSVPRTLRNTHTIDDFWAFTETTLLNILYWNFFNNRQDPAQHTEEEDRKMLNENQILGVARIRQVRVQDDSCKIHPKMARFFNSCYNYYSVFSEETKPIKKGMEGKPTATAWVYTEAEELEASFYWGEISIYGGGGYYLDLSTNINDTVNMLKELKNNNWVSKATRAIFIDFNIYNANANLFCICKIIFELPPVGGLVPVADFQSLKLIRYLNTSDFIVLACEIIYVIFVSYRTWVEIRKIYKQRSSYLIFYWNYLDFTILVLSYVYIIISFIRYFYNFRHISRLGDRYNEYIEFGLVKNLQIDFNNIVAVLLFLSWTKLISYFNFTPTMIQFSKTLEKSLKDILIFFPMFLTMFFAFSVLAYLLFGDQVKEYNSIGAAFLSLLQALLGKFNYSSILESNRLFGPIFYITFVIFIFFVLLNVFVAIINDAYASIRSRVVPESPKILNYLWRGLFNTFTCFKPRKPKLKKSFAVKKKSFLEEIENALKRAGFTEEEIKIFFCKYKINYVNFLDEEVRKRVMKDLELKPVVYSESSEQQQINAVKRRIDDFADRIENLEMRLQPVIDKVDVLLHRL